MTPTSQNDTYRRSAHATERRTKHSYRPRPRHRYQRHGPNAQRKGALRDDLPTRAPPSDSPSGDDPATTPGLCPVCWRAFTPTGRQIFCGDHCRNTAWRRRHQDQPRATRPSPSADPAATSPSTNAMTATPATPADNGATNATGPAAALTSAEHVQTVTNQSRLPTCLTPGESPTFLSKPLLTWRRQGEHFQ